MGFRVLCINKADIGEFGSPYSYEFEKLLQGMFDDKQLLKERKNKSK